MYTQITFIENLDGRTLTGTANEVSMSRQVELSPLDERELEFCHALLNARLQAHKKRGVLLEAIGELLANGPYYLVEEPEDTRAKKPKWITWKTDAADQLWTIQANWRSAAHGPASGPTGTCGDDFDDYLLTAGGQEYKLPPLHLGIQREGQTTALSPTLAVSIRNVKDLSNWLLTRAVANKQISRFAHCVVCGRWELKAISGRRSAAAVEYAKKHRSYAKWLPLFQRLPMWPAVCKRLACKTKYQNTLSGRAKFNLNDFAGLKGDGITQRKQEAPG
jgi:hypothetical protein